MSRPRGNQSTPTRPVNTPTADDFSADSVQRWVLSETLQHPATILPAAGAVVSGIWSGVYGLSPGSLAVTLGLMFVSGTTWIYNFFIRGETLAAARVEELLRNSAVGEEQELGELARRCDAVGFTEGAKEAREILAAYRRLCQYLDDHSHGDESAGVERLRSLARDTFREGTVLVKRALATQLALKEVKVSVLTKELAAWDQRLAKGRMLTDAERSTLEHQIASHRKRLQSVEDRMRELGEIVVQLNELEGALERAYLESVNVIEQDATALQTTGSAATQLERAVAAARRVEDRLRDTTPKEDEADTVYLEASKRHKT